MSSRQKGRRLTTVRYYLSSIRCRFKCPIDELAALREDAAEIVTTGRCTRGKRVDYTSAEALAKAGLTPGEAAGEDEEDTYESGVNDAVMQD